jgi:dihydrodipicolinate reductase
MSISSVTSEALQLKLRQLLPSQQGFGTDLSASDTIIPVIDLTASAEGSDVRQDLQTALAFGSQTAFSVENTSTAIVSTTGFYRIFGAVSVYSASGSSNAIFELSDGVSDKEIWAAGYFGTSVANNGNLIPFDFVVFCNTGESLKATSEASGAFLKGSTRQIADINGTLVQPSGFTPQ